ncbi:MAG: molybdopterin cofactor-binding domain-containing protein [Alphaproteobacteria bacterium]
MSNNPSITLSPGLDKWISITKDGRVVIHSGKVDIGQRISTALSVIAAEELDVELSRIEMVRAETGLSPDEGVTSGSNSMEQSGEAVRLAGATARRPGIRRRYRRKRRDQNAGDLPAGGSTRRRPWLVRYRWRDDGLYP